MGGTFRGESFYSWYSTLILMGCYSVGELGHFLIGIVSKPIAQDMEFGEQGCISNDSSLSYEVQQECTPRNRSLCSLESLNGSVFCEWDYLGSGLEYQLLAGPAFTAIFTVMGIVLGLLGDMFNRIRLLTVCVLVYSLMAILTGLSTEYWQLILLRFGFGAGEAGCTPLTASLVGDMFAQRSRGLAMSVFNWGIYVGYGLAFAVGNYVPEADILGQGWRWSYYITGIPGFLMAFLLFVTVKEPIRKEIYETDERAFGNDGDSLSNDDLQDFSKPETSQSDIKEVESKKSSLLNAFGKLKKVVIKFGTSSSILMLLLASSVRHTASFCWSYNTQIYFDLYYPGYDIAIPMMLCSLIGGSIGIATGGIISDLVVSKYGVSTRLWVLVVSQALAAPLAAMVLYLPPPYCFITLCCAYLFAEMWFGVVITVFVEIVPADIRSTAIAGFAFVINNIGGNLPVIVTELKKAVGGLRNALYITYPGFFLLSSLLFFFTLLLIRRQAKSTVALVEDRSEYEDNNSEIGTSFSSTS